MDLFMAAPMVGWMLIRGHGWRHSLEMAIAMVAPMALIFALRQIGAQSYLPWLRQTSGPAMVLGMIGAMLFRRKHYAGHGRHARQSEAV